jgi:transmembrane sensor
VQNRKEYLKHLLLETRWTQKDREWLLQYLNEDDLSELQEVAAEAYNADLFAAVPLLEKAHSERILESIHQRIRERAAQPLHGMETRVVKVSWFRRWQVAAAAIVVLVAGVCYFALQRKPLPPVVITAAGQRKTIALPDGSKVYLEPGSSLQYANDFGKEERSVNLQGEALFEVNRDDSHPFIVGSSLINTKVLGTSFNMEAKKAGEAKVVVLTGMVEVQAKEEGDHHRLQVIVTANHSAIYNKASHHLETTDAADDARFYLQRQQGRFVYDGTELSKVVNDLERYYNVTISVDRKLQHCAFYGDVNTMDDLDKALNLIAVSLNAKITRNNSISSYEINGGSCQ